MQRELDSLPLPPAQRKSLKGKGFHLIEDVVHLKPSKLSQELEVSMEEALEILKLVKAESKHASSGASKGRSSTALEMLRDERCQQCIVTFSQSLDEVLGGGVPLTKITEFCGAPGVGKTQMSIQLCVDVQIPECFGGLAGECVYIDTEGSFIVDRVVDIAQATVQHCKQIADCEQMPEQIETLETFDFKSILAGIHYFRCHDYVQLIALVHTLPDFLKQHPKVRLVVVDSIAFHFRHDFEDYALRTRLLNGMAQSFVKMAATNRLAVVLTNQMTTKVEKSQSSRLIPALGESWGHASTLRVILYWENSQRYAQLYKSPSRQEAVVPYQVTTGGIRDVAPSQPTEHADTREETSQPTKRQRTM